MRFLGVALMLIGLLALILPYANANFLFLKWADRWGEATSFGIKGGIVFLGFLLWRFGPKS
jgi:hypothetical protein